MKISVEPNHFERFSTKAQGLLNKGLVFSAAYDTAWLARVPQHKHLDTPAFPQALQWLRKHQLSDGSFGTEKPQSAHANTLSTLAAILAFLHWRQNGDETRIARAVSALVPLAHRLKIEPHETIGFEMLLPALVGECQWHKQPLPLELDALYQPYWQKYEEKKLLIRQQQQQDGGFKPASWWFNLEMMGGQWFFESGIELPHPESLLGQHDSVIASPAATAYLLTFERYHGRDLPKADHYLQRLVELNDENGSIPNVFPIDEFEIGFTANYLLEAGVPSTEPILVSLLEILQNMWLAHKGMGLGYSSHVFADPDCSAHGLRALRLAGIENLHPQGLLAFFNGRCIETFAGERYPSVSSNVNVIGALRLFENTSYWPKCRPVIEAVSEWLCQQIQTSDFVLTDKWHFSPIYPMARAVINLQGLCEDVARPCAKWLIEHQDSSGGWGACGCLTAEESAFATLALSLRAKAGFDVPKATLEKARDFLVHADDFPHEALWIGKVFYCPKLVTGAIVAAARSALERGV